MSHPLPGDLTERERAIVAHFSHEIERLELRIATIKRDDALHNIYRRAMAGEITPQRMESA